MTDTSTILSPDEQEVMKDLAQATTTLQQARAELDILAQKKLTIGDEIEAEVKERIKQVLSLSNAAVLQIKANGREVTSIKNTIKDLFEKVLAFADEVLKNNTEFEKYRTNLLADLDKLILEIKENQAGIDHQSRLVEAQWEDIARVRKDQEEREQLMNSRRNALETAIKEFGFKEADIKRRINAKKGKIK